MWIYRIEYEKRGRIRFISHLDTMRAILRAIRRAELPVAYSEGFNPRPRISMGPALPLGYESLSELADVTLTCKSAPDKIYEHLAPRFPEGLKLLGVKRVSPGIDPLSRASSVRYVVELPGEKLFDDAELLVNEFNTKRTALVERERKGKTCAVDVRQFTKKAAILRERDSACLHLEIALGDRGSCSPAEAARAIFKIPESRAKCLRIMRTGIIFEEDKPTGI